MNPMDYLQLGMEQCLRELPDDEFNDLVQRVRPPAAHGSPRADNAQFIKQVLGGNDD